MDFVSITDDFHYCSPLPTTSRIYLCLVQILVQSCGCISSSGQSSANPVSICTGSHQTSRNCRCRWIFAISHYVGFKLESGDRKQFPMSGHEYRILAERDKGTLTY
jgi:hypothetical protein